MRPLAARVLESGRRTNEDVAVPIGLDPVREFGKRGVPQDLGPRADIKRCLRIQIPNPEPRTSNPRRLTLSGQ